MKQNNIERASALNKEIETCNKIMQAIEEGTVEIIIHTGQASAGRIMMKADHKSRAILNPAIKNCCAKSIQDSLHDLVELGVEPNEQPKPSHITGFAEDDMDPNVIAAQVKDYVEGCEHLKEDRYLPAKPETNA